MKVDDTAFLCGYFTPERHFEPGAAWQPLEETAEHEAILRDFYFPEFVDFQTKEVKRYVQPVGKEVTIPLRSGKKLSFRVDEIRLWAMPASLVIFAVKTVFTGTEIDELTEALGVLRNCSFYNNDTVGDFLEVAIKPLGPCPQLVENGNKFKIFQIITSPECPDDYALRDRLLYAAGTVSRYEPGEPFSTDPQYFRQLMDRHRLGVFSSWTALALLDTVTFLGKDVSDFQKGIWTDDYFGMIYVYELFRKCYLYRHNQLFRSGARKPAVLQEELTEFERRYTFTAVSYNFLPAEVDQAIVCGLDLEKEETSLAKIVAQEVSSREEESSGRREKFLLFLTCLASLSAVWDISCLLDEVINYEHTFSIPNWGYRLFSALLLLLIAVVAWRSSRKKK